MDVPEIRATSIAVAPLREPPADPAHARLASGLLEDVIAELARLSGIEVLSARTSLALSPEELEPARMAERFGTTHLLDSSVLSNGDQLLVKTHLIETPSGRQLWSQRYEVPAHEVFAVQADIAAHVANQLSAHINMTRLGAARTRPLTSLLAYDCWLRGQDFLRHGSLDGDSRAREYFEHALSIDPTYARGYTGLSLSHVNEWSCQLWADWDKNERLAYEYARRAAELDETDHVVQTVLGRIQLFRRNFGQARAHFERALALSPNDAETLVQIAIWTGYLGDGERAVAMAEKALRLNPLHGPSYFVYAALPYFFTRQLDRTLALLHAAPADMMVDQPAFIAACHAHRGELPEARAALAQFRHAFRERITFGREPEPDEPQRFVLHVNPFARQADADFLLQGLALAGLAVAAPAPQVAYRARNEAQSARFSLDGDSWQVSFANRSVRVRDMKGCRDIALLLASAHERIHCMEIAGRMAEGHAGAALDARARADCQRRLRELGAELESAEADKDLGRQAALSEERERLIDSLSAALGLGGRERKLGDPAEKARTAVTARIRSAIKKLGAAHPELGRHLEVSIRTGAFCTYAPEHRIEWVV